MNQFFAYLLFSFVVQLLSPKPKIQRPKAAGLSEFTFPSASTDRQVPIIWGTCKVVPNWLYVGELESREKTKSVRTGVFTTDKQFVGREYYLTAQLGWTFGPAPELLTAVVEGNDSPNIYFLPQADPDLLPSMQISARFREKDAQVDSGFSGTLRFRRPRFDTATPDPYIENLVGAGKLSAYSGILCSVFEKAFVGNTNSATPIYLVMRRLSKYASTQELSDGWREQERLFDVPDDAVFGGNLAAFDNVNGDANPALALAEILTSKVFGRGWSRDVIDGASFIAAAQTLHAEGNGLAYQHEDATGIDGLIDSILEQVNGVLDVDHSTSKVRLRLLREAEPVAASFDDSTLLDLSDVKRTASAERITEVQVPFTDRDRKFKQSVAVAQDAANSGSFRDTNVLRKSFIGVSNESLAGKLASRELRAGTTSLVRCTATVQGDPLGYVPRLGDVVDVSSERKGLELTRFRVMRVEYGEDFVCKLDLMQDIFYDGVLLVAPSVAGSGSPGGGVAGLPQSPFSWFVQAAPFGLTREQLDRLIIVPSASALDASRTTAAQVCYAPAGTMTINADTAEYSTQVVPLGMSGTLATGMLSTANETSISILCDAASRAQAGTLAGPFFIVVGLNEWMIATARTVLSDRVVFSGLTRAVFDTLPATHAAGTQAWAFSSFELDNHLLRTEIYDDYLSGERVVYSPGVSSVFAGAELYGPGGTKAADGVEASWSYSAADDGITRNRAARPNPPGYVRANGVIGAASLADASIVSGRTVQITFAPRPKNTADPVGWFEPARYVSDSQHVVQYQFRNSITQAWENSNTVIVPAGSSVASYTLPGYVPAGGYDAVRATVKTTQFLGGNFYLTSVEQQLHWYLSYT